MLKKIFALICAVVVSTAAFSLFVYADNSNGKLIKKDGNLYCMDGDKYITGWQEVGGNLYFFKKTGEAATKSTTIGGIRYKFSSDGICKGKYTGWARSGDKKFYYSDGEKAKGWFWSPTVNKPNEWFYFDEKSGALATNTAIIDGNKYEFSSNGVWKGKNSIDSGSCYAKLTKKLSKNDYGGIYIHNGSLIVLSVNDKNVRKVTDKMRERFAQIVVKECKFSVSELEKIEEHIWEKRKEYGIAAISIDVMNNRVEVEMPKDNDKFSEYINSLHDSDIVYIKYGNGAVVED